MANSYIIHKVREKIYRCQPRLYFFRERRKKVSEYTSRIHGIVFYGKNDKKKKCFLQKKKSLSLIKLYKTFGGNRIACIVDYNAVKN